MGSDARTLAQQQQQILDRQSDHAEGVESPEAGGLEGSVGEFINVGRADPAKVKPTNIIDASVKSLASSWSTDEVGMAQIIEISRAQAS